MRFFPGILGVLLTVALPVVSCAGQHQGTGAWTKPKTVEAGRQQSSTMTSESEALELAKKEFVKNGCKLEDYDVRIHESKPSRQGVSQKWIAFFERKEPYRVPGSDALVTVDKATGTAVFVPGV